MWDIAEAQVCHRLVEPALEEDLGVAGDVTSLAIIPETLMGRADFVARSPGVLSGLPAGIQVANAVDARLQWQSLARDGDLLQRGTQVASVEGPMRSILAAERTALNFMQHLSGIATLTRRFVEAVAGLPVRILDTRKTLPGWRILEKYAVRCGGGHNHRVGLYDGILIKDNHLASLGNRDTIAVAVQKARQAVQDRIPVEIEVDNLDQLDVALTCSPTIILLDNMSLEQLRECVRRRNASAPNVALEASGGVTLATVRSIAETGVDRISIGALTHSAPALDLALDYRM